MIDRAPILALAVILFASTAAGQVPDLNVVPDQVDDNVSAYNSHGFEVTFSNQDSSQSIHNVTVENTSYLSWNDYSFDLAPSGSKTVNASFYTENITTFKDSLRTEYGYAGSDNRFDGPNISFNISTYYEETTVKLSTFETDFELEFGESDSSVFTIENTGSERAFNVSLEAEDIEFGRDSGFDIPPGEDVLVEYNVSIPLPEEDATEKTNQTYARTVNVWGENFNETSFESSVFVPFKQYDTEEEERSLVDQFVEFCSNPENSDSIICSDRQIVRYENNTETVYRTPEANISLTTEEILALKELSNTTTEKYQDILHRVRLQQNTFRSELEATRSNLSESFGEVGNATEANREMIRNVNQTVNEFGEVQVQEARNRTFWMMLLFALGALYLLCKFSWWVYENKEELKRDSRWTIGG